MPDHLGAAASPPHYTPPKSDGSIRGTFWFNVHYPETGSGWLAEAITYHEAVPGHHLQLSRSQQLKGLPSLQTQGTVNAHSEGWGLYAEILAGEFGLYTSTESEAGALALQLIRAARLVVDTGLHALGWGLDRAIQWFSDTVPLPRASVEAEVRRYVAWPAQALSYAIGLREFLRLRAAAEAKLGDRFSLGGFHSAVLDHGAVPLPAMSIAVQSWIDAAAASANA